MSASPFAGSPRFRSLLHLLVGGGLFIVVALVYWPGLTGAFLLDDYPQIVHQDAVHMRVFDARSIQAALDGFRHGIGRPLPMLSFALDHFVWGLDPWGFKLSGVIVHAVNAVLVYALILRLVAIVQPGVPRSLAWTAGILSAAWALHPLQASTVLYVVQRMETLSHFFVFGALLAYLWARRRQMEGLRGWPGLALCGALMSLGLACKETAALVPAYALTLEFFVLRFRAAEPSVARNLHRAYTLLVLSALAGAAWLATIYIDPIVYAIRDYSAWERILTQGRVLSMYIGWILVPDPGSYLFYYDQYPPSRGLLSPATTLFGWLFLLALGVAAAAARKHLPLFSLGIGWFFAAHLLTSSFIPLELVFEHRNYFALLGMVLALYSLAARLLAKRISSRSAGSFGLLLVTGVAVLGLIRTATWGEPLHLALELAQRNPTSARAGTGLGDQYLLMANRRIDDPFVSLARAEYERVAILPDASPIPDQALILLAAQQGVAADPAWWDRIVRKLSNRPIGPQEMTVVTSLLDLRNQGLDIDDRRLSEAYTILARRMSLPATQYFAFAMHALNDLQDEALAFEMLQATVQHAAGDKALLAELSTYLRDNGHPDAAEFLDEASRDGSPYQ